ncbi:MAG: bifunctional phosphoglucose/phosphomannose isomerase [Bacteroidota bacterium]|jgi:glucose/mannose-6-phosphate isomerase
MKELVERFPAQLREAIAIGESSKITAPSSPIQNVVITGLGGSGIGGTILAEVVAGSCPVPVMVNKDYFLPSFVGPGTLVIVSSYSGNTEETIEAMQHALRKNAKIVCITSGGKIAEMAGENGLDLILIPGGMPPRSCLGYSLTQLFYVLKGVGLIDGSFRQELEASLTRMEQGKAVIQAEANAVTDFLFRKMPVIYAADGYNGVATRFRQQINENSKMLCWHHILPEMNHNELVGWAEQHPECAVVFLRNETDYFRTQARMEISKEIMLQRTPHVLEIWSKGGSHLERSLYLIHLTDWASCYLADRKGIDAVEVNVINHLKGSLAKI